ncbi:dihydropyrimidinase [Pseudomonas duriflava]|uniref:Dihydropyrimidinase n=1 Tax=Pseudomonas duriflava TaxID=459528 RepID=A0A562PYY8_9PSED|nr:dihydropyrimidinase [Pseudomonas duriflava]TWI49608.1 dihydropyrimidinase [Pseudomonas duriflava]
MTAFDLTVRNGRVATASDTFEADIGIRDGLIVALEKTLPPGRQDIDAAGRWVLPGGVDSHCHVEQLSGMGVMCADDFYSATVSAAFGGTTTIIPFAAQHRGHRLPEVVADYSRRAAEKAVIDYAFHLILTDPTPEALSTHLPDLIRSGITSFKVFMTYEALKLGDAQILDVLAVADREGALVMVHAENNDIIHWIVKHLQQQGFTEPKYHAVAHAPLAEAEATHRAITLARLLDTPLLIVHVSQAEAIATIRQAQGLGAHIHAETCPQYLFLTAEDIDLPGVEGAKFCCSPPPRDRQSQDAVWQGLLDGTLALFSSDHAPYRFDETGKLPQGEKTTFKQIANGLPGLEVRMPLLFSEGVIGGKISINEFVALTATNHARMYGLLPRKGTIAIGSDADLALWNPERKVVLTDALMHDNVGYTPYAGRQVQGWPEVVINRGRIVVDDGTLHAERGSGRFLPCGLPEPVRQARARQKPAHFIRTLFENAHTR